ncbi:MAG: DUF1501 domain-containing protein [Rhodocyclaceae bacterium]
MTPTRLSRRECLKRLGALSALGGAAPFALNLAGLGAASAQSAPADYRAIVCLFMFGGNDHHNMIMPYDQAAYDTYAAARGGARSVGGIAYDRAQLTGTKFSPLTPQAIGSEFAFCPSMAALHNLYGAGKLAVLPNIGPLITPTTRTTYNAGSVPLPPKLFSHNDQQSVWQAFASEGVKLGWGGRMGDLLASSNSQSIFTAISASGNAVFLAGQSIFQYQVGTSGATAISGITGSSMFGLSGTAATVAKQSLTELSTDSINASTLAVEADHADVVERSVAAQSTVTSALASVPTSTSGITLPANLTNNRLAQQLQVVARLIGARATTGAKRQVFFVSIGGFDTHDNEITTLEDNTTSGALGLHGQVSRCMDYFYNATVALGIQNNVTLFTASDFGRTLTSNGDGSDHGWGAHHFVMGGAVKGGDMYGTMPDVRLHTTASPNLQDSGSGRLIPTTSVELAGGDAGALVRRVGQ